MDSLVRSIKSVATYAGGSAIVPFRRNDGCIGRDDDVQTLCKTNPLRLEGSLEGPRGRLRNPGGDGIAET